MKSINLTLDQQKATNGLIEFFNEPFNPNKYISALIGSGGTGKTFCINYILNNCKIPNSTIKCTSPTHKACRVFSKSINNKEVHTIQSTFGLRLDLKLENFDPKNPQFNPNSSPKLEEIRVLIIDEASMLPAKLVTYICDKCKELEIKILFIGDDKQLPPVNESKSIAFARAQLTFTLTEIVRQQKENKILFLLNMLRNDIDNKTFNFLNYIYKNKDSFNIDEVGNGFFILNETDFINKININFQDEDFKNKIDKYKIISYTNIKVKKWNDYVRRLLIEESDKHVLSKNDLVMSYETIVDDFLSPILFNSEEYIINDIIDFVSSDYGFKGFLVKFQLVDGGKITPPIFVIDHTDKWSINKYYQTLKTLANDAKNATRATRVAKWKTYYNFKKKYLTITNILNNRGDILNSRDLDYGFSITSHKSQGSTYDNVFVDLKDMLYDKNNNIHNNFELMFRLIYVACSRTKFNLYINYG